MYIDIKELYGRKLGATDGDIGHVKDFYFDDKSWAIRYLVVDTGSWLTGRLVLLSSHAFGAQTFEWSNADAKFIEVNLTRKQIENSPSIDTHRPVSRQYEEDYFKYYGWPNYWQDTGLFGLGALPVVIPPPESSDSPHHGHIRRDDVHLRSSKSITGYQIHATDGAIGTVSSFIMHGSTWSIRELVVETGHWYAGKPILLLPENIIRISYEDSTVYVNLTKEDIRRTTKNNIAQAAFVQH